MSRKCAVTGKTRMIGNRVSHAKNRTKVALGINIQTKRIFSPKLGRFVKVRISTHALKTTCKKDIFDLCNEMGVSIS